MSTFDKQLAKIKNDKGFIAALDQSGGSTPKALKLYGVDDTAWKDEKGMYDVVHVMRTVVMRGVRTRRIRRLALFPSGRAHDPAARHGQAHVVHAVIRVELRGGVELPAVPAGVLEDADFREPVRDEKEIAKRAGARVGPRYPRGPREIKVQRFSRLHRTVQRDRQHRLVRGIAVVRSDIPSAEQQILNAVRSGERQRREIDGGAVLVRPFGERAVAAERLLAQP